jgi:hypothetical protein
MKDRFPKEGIPSNRIGEKSDWGRCGNTRHLTRIITFFLEQKSPVIKKNISDNLGLTNRLDDALNWLVCNGIVLKSKESNSHDRFTYILNPDFLKLVERRHF